ncbi:MAG: MarR family transcriptional regulator [Henriciella sp.]|nr:MarR family transcriptional regulator [Henriciella sp.]
MLRNILPNDIRIVMEQPQFYDSDTIKKAYTAKKLLDLAYLILDQVSTVYTQKGMIFPVICSSTLLFLSKRKPASVTEIARALEHPHQTVAQHLKTLDKLGIVQKRPDKTDKRRSEYHLTEVGKVQAQRLDEYNLQAADVFKSLDEDIGADLGKMLDTSIAALAAHTMEDRFKKLFSLHRPHQ